MWKRDKSLLLLKTEPLYCGHPPQSLITTMIQLSWLFISIIKNDPMHTRNADGGVDIQLYSFLTLALSGVGSQIHAPAAVPPGKRALLYPTECCIWGGGGGGAVAGPIWKMWRKVSYSCQDCNHSFPDVQHSPVIVQTTLIFHDTSLT
jgi:hypothetical protein